MSSDTDSYMAGIAAIALATASIPLGIAAGFYLSFFAIFLATVALFIVFSMSVTEEIESRGASEFLSSVTGATVICFLSMWITAIATRWDKVSPFISEIFLR